MTQIIVKIRKLHPDAVTPAYATELAAGFDLVAVEDVIIAPGETALVPIGLAFEIPPDFEMQIRPRSGVSYRTKLRVANSPGTIDADYRGEIKVIIDNISQEHANRHPNIRDAHNDYLTDVGGKSFRTHGRRFAHGTYSIRKGDRIAQGVIAPMVRADFEVVDELSETERGAGGFGSTGTKSVGVTAEEAAENMRKAFEALPTMAEVIGK